jgi:hypothetical protein
LNLFLNFTRLGLSIFYIPQTPVE